MRYLEFLDDSIWVRLRRGLHLYEWRLPMVMVYRFMEITRCKIRLFYYRFCGKLYFRKLGRGITFFGPVRVGFPFGDITIGDSSQIGRDVFLSAYGQAKISIGKNVSLGSFSVIISLHRVAIGDYTRIAECVGVRDHDHAIMGTEDHIFHSGYTIKEVNIGRNVWIGRCVTVCKGVSIGDHTVIGANSVVTKDIPIGAIAAGCPAKIIRYRGK